MFEGLSFLEWLILVLIGLLFFKEQAVAWISSKLGLKNGNGAATSGQVETLASYYNHDITSRLEKLVEASENIARGVERIQDKHGEWDKYGIKVRCDEFKKT